MSTTDLRAALEQCTSELADLDLARADLVSERDDLIVRAYEGGVTVRQVASWARLSAAGIMRVVARH
jgi:hypothetical protein